MFDIFLVAITGATQLAMAYLGLRVSTSPPSNPRRMEAAFIVVGLVGLMALVWACVRATDTQDGITGTLTHLTEVVEGKFSKPPIATVKVAIPVPCKVDIGPDPAYPSKDDYVNAKNIDDRVRLVVSELLMRRAREPVLKAAIKGCGGD